MDWKQVEGWFGDGDAAEYRRLLERVPDGSYVAEIGTFKGRSLASVADVIIRKNLHVYGIDTFGSVKYADKDVMARSAGMLETFNHNMVLFGLDKSQPGSYGHVRAVRSTSLEAAKEFSEPEAIAFGLVFIDGDHSYEAVKADLAAWWPLVREGGILCGHDYGGGWLGVRQAVDEFFHAKNICPYVKGELWSVRK